MVLAGFVGFIAVTPEITNAQLFDHGMGMQSLVVNIPADDVESDHFHAPPIPSVVVVITGIARVAFGEKASCSFWPCG